MAFVSYAQLDKVNKEHQTQISQLNAKIDVLEKRLQDYENKFDKHTHTIKVDIKNICKDYLFDSSKPK
jgi:hypothetical protein